MTNKKGVLVLENFAWTPLLQTKVPKRFLDQKQQEKKMQGRKKAQHSCGKKQDR